MQNQIIMLPSQYIETGWAQGALSRDINGESTEATSCDARSW